MALNIVFSSMTNMMISGSVF